MTNSIRGFDGRRRILVEAVTPQVAGGRYPAKRIVGEPVTVEADLIVDGHDLVAGVLCYRRAGDTDFHETPLAPLGNDRYRAAFTPTAVGRWEYTVEAWVDAYATWCRGLSRKVAAEQDVTLDLLEGAELLAAAAARAAGGARDALAAAAAVLGDAETPAAARAARALDPALVVDAGRYPDRSHAARREPPLTIVVDPLRARFSAWYELFPRSTAPGGHHGTLADTAARLEYVKSMGFDVVYLPPVHPIGRRFRKGKNNAETCAEGDVGSPWAIGAAEGGHDALHPELGTLQDFANLVARARALGMEVALDIAFQASQDHPYLEQHPEWFVRRPDGSIHYAENPPKKYQDVVPFNLAGEAWDSLWRELLRVVEVWIERGVRVFRIDNPHTKPLAFWEWLIGEVKSRHPEVVFLAEAFTRPKVMYALARAGFSQSYTYFTWRTTRAELTDYLSELCATEVAEYFRPNLWPQTPDILPEHLQYGGRPTFIARAVLAATLSASWGVYGPAFELMEHVPREGVEEYLDNEKYQIRSWDLGRSDSLRPMLARLNRIRREHPALQDNRGLRFHGSDNDLLLAYSKTTAAGEDPVLMVVNLDPRHRHAGWIDLDLAALGLSPDETFQVHDLLSEARYSWRGRRGYVELDPQIMPAHIFRVRRFVRRERDFEYFA